MAYENEGFIGSGDLNIDVYNASGALTGELDVGNAKAFAINAPKIEKKELTGFRRENYGKKIASVPISKEQELKITLTDINRKNLVLAMMGTDAAYSQTAGNNTSTPETVVAVLGKWVKLANRRLDPAHKPVVTGAGTTPPTYVEGTDYEIDYQVGRIRALSGGAITDATSIEVGSTWLGITNGFKVQALTQNTIYAFIRMIGKDLAYGRDCEVIVHKVELVPSGDINWLTDDFASLEFTGTILNTPQGDWDVLFY
jgi:hypothetical protein